MQPNTLATNYTVPINKCTSCSKDHANAVIVINDARVWYRCPQTYALVYVKDARKE